jgi:hypothetical protein
MSRRKLRPAVELVSDIGSLGFDLQHHGEEQIREAVKLLRTVNPEMFDWLARLLGDQLEAAADVTPTLLPAVERRQRIPSVPNGADSGDSQAARLLGEEKP